jgi:hypothetical protein
LDAAAGLDSVEYFSVGGSLWTGASHIREELYNMIYDCQRSGENTRQRRPVVNKVTMGQPSSQSLEMVQPVCPLQGGVSSYQNRPQGRKFFNCRPKSSKTRIKEEGTSK